MPGSCDSQNNLEVFELAISELNPNALQQLYQEHGQGNLRFFAPSLGLRLLEALSDVYPQPSDANAQWILHFLLSNGAAAHVQEINGRNAFLEKIRASGHYELCSDIQRCLQPDYQAPALPEPANLYSAHSASARSLGLISGSSKGRSQRASPIFFDEDGLSPRYRQPSPTPRPELFTKDPATISSSTLHTQPSAQSPANRRRSLGLAPTLMSEEDLKELNQRQAAKAIPPLISPSTAQAASTRPPSRTEAQQTKSKQTCCSLL